MLRQKTTVDDDVRIRSHRCFFMFIFIVKYHLLTPIK